MINILYIISSFAAGVATGVYLYFKLRRKKPIKVTAETTMDGKVYSLGFSYDPKNDDDKNKFIRSTGVLRDAFIKTFTAVKKRGVCND